MNHRNTVRSVTRAEMVELDRKAIEDYGIPALVLMENAGLRSAESARKILRRVKGKSAAIFCGKGNNGGDGLVCARHLINQGYTVKICLLGKASEIGSDPVITNLNILKKMGADIREIPGVNDLRKHKPDLAAVHLIIDAIFGIGLAGPVRGYPGRAITLVNSLGKPVLSLDVPSGLDADTGLAAGPCVKASETITFGFPKKGLLCNDGPQYAGKVTVADIGLPRPAPAQSVALGLR